VADDAVRLSYAQGSSKIVDFKFSYYLDDGIDTSLYD